MRPVISIIVPIYNVEKLLKKCLESICNQTYSGIEIILVDDGSKDGSLSICNEYAKKDERIVVIHQENKGLSGARNSGIKAARGKYIGFVDSDDYIEEHMYEKMLECIEKEGADVVIGNYVFVNEEGNRLSDSDVITDETLSGTDALKKLQTSGRVYYTTAWNKLYKKEIFNGLEFAEGKINEDVFIIHEVFHKCRKVATISDEVYFYVQRENSIMTRELSIGRLDIFEALFNRYLFYKHNNLDKLLCVFFDIVEEEYFIREKIKCNSLEDKERIKEIDKMIWKMYYETCDKKCMKRFIKYKFPNMFLSIYYKYKKKGEK